MYLYKWQLLLSFLGRPADEVYKDALGLPGQEWELNVSGTLDSLCYFLFAGLVDIECANLFPACFILRVSTNFHCYNMYNRKSACNKTRFLPFICKIWIILQMCFVYWGVCYLSITDGTSQIVICILQENNLRHRVMGTNKLNQRMVLTGTVY